MPVIGPILVNLKRCFLANIEIFSGSNNYWINRYDSGGNSGPGSYNKLADFKAGIINKFVAEKNITSVIEYGCGDGNQLKLANYPRYIGYDISPKAISLCQETFRGDQNKTFILMSEYNNETATLTLSLDVIYHLIEDDIYDNYMRVLFDSSHKYVIIYSSNCDLNTKHQPAHVKHRRFTDWINSNKCEWELIHKIDNKFSLANNVCDGSFADFYIYGKDCDLR